MHGKLTTFAVDPAASRVVVVARSSVHDTETLWDKLSGEIEADPEKLGVEPTRASIVVDMRSFDAGDWLKNRKIKQDLDVAAHPNAEFVLEELTNVVEEDGAFRAVAIGVLSWRGREVRIEATGVGAVSQDLIEASASFELDVTTLGVKAPKILMFKVEDVVTIDVTLVARTTSSEK